MKKMFKILLWTAGVLVVLLILAVVGLKLFLPADKIKAMAVEEGSVRLGREVAVEGLDISVWGGLGVVLQNVRIGNPDGIEGPDFLTADNIDLKLQLFPLISGDIMVDRLIIDAPVVQMRKSETGEVNYAFAPADSAAMPAEAADVPPEGQAAALAISFDELEINDGRIRFDDDSTGLALELTGVDLASSLEYPREGFYESTGRLRADSVVVAMPEPYPPVAFDLNYKVSYDMAAGDLTIERANTAVNEARFKLTGRLGNLTDAMAVDLNVQSEQISISNLLSLLPAEQRALLNEYTVEGNFTLDADLDYDAAVDTIWDYAGTAVLSDVAMSSQAFEGDLEMRRCLVDFKPDNLRMNIEDGSFDKQPLKGHLVVDGFENPEISGELAGALELALLEPYLPAEAGHRVSGRSEFDLKFSGPVRDPEKLSFTGNLRIGEGTYNSPLVPEPIETFDLDAYFDNRLLKVRQMGCRFSSGQLTFTGRVTDLVPFLLADSGSAVSMEVEATVNGNVDLAIATPFLNDKGAPELSGELVLDVGFGGRVDDLTSFRSHGTVAVRNAAYSDSLLPEPIEQFDAAFLLKPDTIEVTRMTARFTSSDVSFQGSLIEPFPYFLPIIDLDRSQMTKPLFLFALSSHRFDTDRLFPQAVPGAGSETVVLSADSVSAVILPDIDGRGTVSADTVIYTGVELTQVTARIRVSDRKIECYDANARVYTGSVAGKTTIDLSDFDNPRYTGEFDATQIEANDFISRFTKFGGHMFGKANFKGDYDAQGWEPEDFLNSLTVDGDMDVRDGRVVTSGAVFSALSGLASQMGETYEKEQTIKEFASKLEVRDGRVFTDSIATLLGELGLVSLNGSYGFDETLDYAGSFLMSQKSSGKASGLSKLFGTGDAKQVHVPFKVGGTIMSPKIEIDYSALGKQAAENLLKDAASDLLKKLK